MKICNKCVFYLKIIRLFGNSAKHADIVLLMVDGRFENDKKDLSLKFRGSSNQRVIDVQKSLETRGIVSLYTD